MAKKKSNDTTENTAQRVLLIASDVIQNLYRDVIDREISLKHNVCMHK